MRFTKSMKLVFYKHVIIKSTSKSLQRLLLCWVKWMESPSRLSSVASQICLMWVVAMYTIPDMNLQMCTKRQDQNLTPSPPTVTYCCHMAHTSCCT